MSKEGAMGRLIALILGAVGLLAAADARATPNSMSFAGRLNASDGPVNGPVSITFAVHSAMTGGTPVWTETFNLTADQGLVFANLGNATNPLDDTVFTGNQMFLAITVQGEALTPRLSIGSTPYAIRSTSADSADLLGTLSPSDVVIAVNPGSGLMGGGAGGAVTLAINSALVQSRITGTCPSGQSINAVTSNGSVTCEVDDNTTYTAGSGIAIAGTAVSLATCPTGQILKSTGTSWSCQTDNIGTYTASTGITITGTQIAVDSAIIARKDTAGGNQAFDTNTLFLDYGNNRVGIGTTTPAVALEVAGVTRATDLQYAAPIAGQVMAVSNWCMRQISDPHSNTETINPPDSASGPSISDIAQTPNSATQWFCPIHLDVPPGSPSVTITGVTMAFHDASGTCRVQGDLRFKTFGSSSSGTVVASIFSGVDVSDFATVSTASTKAIAGLAVTATPNTVVWMTATIAQNATGGGDCRYSGVLVNYTVTHP
jgi:hypothetical protein